jgi:uncharacterized protein (DUF2062 family)
VIFRRRDKRPWWRIVVEFIWPRGGWGRAFTYVKHRLHRLPDPPDRIARGIFAGVFTTFTPFYGMHFIVAGTIAWILRGNIPAALLGTFFGNPLTYLPIGVVSLQTGHAIMGRPTLHEDEISRSLGGKFLDAGTDLKNNFLALFTDRSRRTGCLLHQPAGHHRLSEAPPRRAQGQMGRAQGKEGARKAGARG